MYLSDIFDSSKVNIHYFSLGRHALAASFNLFGIGKGDKVLVPEFICRDLLASIHSVYAEPIYYKVNKDLSPVSLPFYIGVKAVIAVNYFGFPQNLEPFHEYCNNHSAILIEDNAHGFLSYDESGLLLGTRGDCGVFSFRKTFFLPDGAALIECNSSLRVNKIEPLKCNDNCVSLGYYVKSYISHIQNSFSVPLRSYAEKITRLIRKIKTGHELPAPVLKAEAIIPSTPEINCRSLSILSNKNMKNESERRRKLYLKFDEHLQNMKIEPVYTVLSKNTVPYGYPFRASNDVAAQIEKIAFRDGFNCTRWPDLPVSLQNNISQYHKNVWWINFLC